MRTVLEDHVGWLADEPRMEGLRRAIAATVRAGDIVVDVGTGTGILALMACQAGAARVYAIERGPIIELARKLARANRCEDRIAFLRGDASQIRLPEPADVVLCDLIGEFAFDVGLFDVLTDARRRWLKPGGRMIPQGMTLSLGAIELPGLRRQFEFLDARPGGFDMTPLSTHTRHTAYRVFPAADALLSTTVAIAHYDLRATDIPEIHARCTLDATRNGTMDAIAGWFDAELAPGVHMTNAPLAEKRIDRRVVALPVSPAFSVRRGDQIDVEFRLLAHAHVFSWRVVLRGRDAQAVSGCTLTGALISREDLL